MDLYLVSPVFLKKMMRRSSGITDLLLLEGGQDINAVPEDTSTASRVLEDALENQKHHQLDEEEAEEASLVPGHSRGRRRSSLDRLLRQQAYIIICMLCYTYTRLTYRV